MFILAQNLPVPPVAPQPRSPSSTLLVVYPPVGYSTTASQIFLVGSAPATGSVLVNGQQIRRSATGNFSPSFPLSVGENKFIVEYSGQSKTIAVVRTLAQPELPIDGFAKDSLYPNVPIARLPGELICLSAIAPPNSIVTALLGQQSLPLVPDASTTILADNLSVLTGKLEAQAVTGTYQGCMALSQPFGQIGATGNVSTGGDTLGRTLGKPIYELKLPDGRSIRETAKGTIDVLDPARLTTVEVTASPGVARTGSNSEFARLTPLPKGVRDRVTGKDGIWQRLSYGAWIKETETKVVSRSGVPVESLVSGVTSRLVSDWTELRIPLQTPVPITVNQTDRTVQLTLHHTISQAGIQRLVNNPTISHVTWQQITPTQIQYTLHLKTNQAWGYKTRYEGNLLVLSLRNPPVLTNNLKGIKILLDPGHGSSEDLGSVGNGGIPEKDVTIVVSKLLRDRLTKRGATVIMTREGDDDIGPNERAQLITKVEPTIALSLHYNALPDGGDAEKTQGLSAFWYHPQSQSLAQFLHDYVTQKLDRKSDNVFWNNLALARPTVAPSILIELGYMINPEEYAWITNPVQQNKLADTLADGIEAWLRSR